jgi:hypothetical protein
MLTKRDLLAKATRLGVDDILLDAYNTVKNREYDFGDVDEKIRSFELDPKKKRGEVLLPITQGRNRVAYAVLAHAFRTRGYEPVIPLCRSDLPVCTYKGARYNKDDFASCAICHHYGTSLLETFGLEPIHVSEILPDEYDGPHIEDINDITDVRYRGIDASRYALASTRQFFMKRSIDYEDDYEGDVYRRFLRAAMKLVDVSSFLFENRSIKTVMGFHHAYIYAGIYLEVAENFGIPAISISRGYRDQTLVFGNKRNRLSRPQFTDATTVSEFLEQPLTREQKTRINEIIEGRRDGSTTRFDHVRDARSSIDFDSSTEVVGLFTNLIWDASLEVDNLLFDEPYHWVKHSIEKFDDLENTVLVIKAHPAEALRGTNESVEQWIHDQYDTLPDSVLLLGSETDVSPYALMEEMDAAIVYTSTVGIESAYEGIPVIVAGDTQYRGFEFTYDPETIEEYDTYLRKVGEIEMTPEMHRRARRYAYLLFIRSHMNFPFYESLPEGGVRPLEINHDDITLGNETFDLIVKSAIENEPIVYPEGFNPD